MHTKRKELDGRWEAGQPAGGQDSNRRERAGTLESLT